MLEKQLAVKGVISKGVRYVAGREKIKPAVLSEKVAEGKAIILKHKNMYLGIGEGLKTKVNANIGTSPDIMDVNFEIEKLKVACKYGADTVMDLSTGGDIDKIRNAVIERSPVPIGTVPVYQAVIESIEEKGALVKMKPDKLFEVIERQASSGVAFTTLHCGVTLKTLERLKRNPRKSTVVSRGGAFLIGWMVANGKENPLYKDFDRVIEIAKKYDLVISLGDGMRPGGLADSTDIPQIEELLTLGELTRVAWENNIQVIIEGPGHIPINEIPANVILQKKICKGAPFYVLGPLPTDIAPGYDHITSAIGAAIAGWYGTDYICYVTPSEHLSLPEIKDVIEGTVAAKIAAHIADIGKGLSGAKDWDYKMDIVRTKRDWKSQRKLAIDPHKFDEYYKKHKSSDKDVCTMCGKYCAIKTVERYLRTKISTP